MVKPRYLLDTNILSEPLRPQPDSSVMKQLERHYHEVATANVADFEHFIDITVENWFFSESDQEDNGDTFSKQEPSEK
ncbi:MAG: hypothetical protein WGN25_14510 [Candidatus Electrothrix sp. GW3-4]|uniref:hypothetical protein n=1 Tax=Candidatus Electrothrix sp. GW3-4 TaxID=3126740 RepID=UPI0030D23E3E